MQEAPRSSSSSCSRRSRPSTGTHDRSQSTPWPLLASRRSTGSPSSSSRRSARRWATRWPTRTIWATRGERSCSAPVSRRSPSPISQRLAHGLVLECLHSDAAARRNAWRPRRQAQGKRWTGLWAVPRLRAPPGRYRDLHPPGAAAGRSAPGRCLSFHATRRPTDRRSARPQEILACARYSSDTWLEASTRSGGRSLIDPRDGVGTGTRVEGRRHGRERDAPKDLRRSSRGTFASPDGQISEV